MKRSILVLAVALACLVAAPVALAQSRVGCDPGGSTPPGDGTTFYACGTVASVDTVNNLLTVNVTNGSDASSQSAHGGHYRRHADHRRYGDRPSTLTRVGTGLR